MIKIIEAPLSLLSGFGVNLAWFFAILGAFLVYVVFQILDSSSSTMIRFMIAILPIWLPIVTFLLFHEYWLYYVRKHYNLKLGRITLEIKLPQDVFKSPEAMELVLLQMHQKASVDNHLQTYWDGKHPPKWGLEIVSRGGDVRFYISLPPRFKNQAEAHLYAQYPGIQIHELEIDYAAEIPWDTEKYSYFSMHLGKKEHEALPIKTYFDFGMHSLPKEEEKIDPITSLIEGLATIGPGEYVWMQILIDANIARGIEQGSLRKKPDWKAGAKAERERIIDEAKKRSGGEEVGGNIMQTLTEGERETIKAIERGMSKSAFNTAIRALYIGEKATGVFNPSLRFPAITTGLRAFDDNMRNAIGIRWRTDFNWNWWQDPKGKRAEAYKRSELNEYKRRYYQAHDDNGSDSAKAFTIEELATVFHMPGQVAVTPTLGRAPSKTSTAPSNLPTG